MVEISGIKEHEVLKPHTYLGIGGVADFYFEARSIDDLVLAVSECVKAQLPYLILGAGSKMLISDFGFPGLVIRNLTSNISFIAPLSQVIVDSGVLNARLVMEAASRGLGGLEFLSTLPGTIGGTIYGNSGNFGFEIASFVRAVTVLEPPDKIATYKGDWLKSGYLTSRLKKSKEKPLAPVLLTAKLQLQQYNKDEILRKIAYYQKLNKPFSQGGQIVLGPVFKNPSGEPNRIGDDPDVLWRCAGEVLKRSGAFKLRSGKAKPHQTDPNKLIASKTNAREIRILIESLKQAAFDIEHVKLEEAVEYVGRWE